MVAEKEILERYERQIKLPQVGRQGQEKICRARVLIIGCGGLGSPVALYLAAAGVGAVGMVDFDRVELNNLQRQIIHSVKDIGGRKVDSARTRLHGLNPEIKIKTYPLRLNAENILEIIKGYDIICDCTDNFPTRYLLNDACVLSAKPLVQASVYGFDGQAMVIIPGKGPCYRCLYPQPPGPECESSCRQAGILGTVAGVLGTIQAHEVLKLILKVGDSLMGRLLVFNGLDSTFKTVQVQRLKDCAVCSNKATIKTLLSDYGDFC